MLRSLSRSSRVQHAAHAPSARPLHSFSAVPTRAVRRQADALAGRASKDHPHSFRHFHATRTNQGLPVLALLGALKASTAIQAAQTLARVALTFVPFIVIKNHKSRRFLKAAARMDGRPGLEERKEMVLKRMRNATLIFRLLVFAPIAVFWAAILASLERTPLTGRWRLILLSPEEEDEISAQLAGSGWYHAVGEILSQESPPTLLSPDDWRYEWVRSTLRHLEQTVPALSNEHALNPSWLERGSDDKPFPPPADYPLRPRPRGAEYVRMFYDTMVDGKAPPVPHAVPGPPYSLIVVDKPGSSNAFSYGFGPDGAGGIVVYSGFLDEVLAKHPPLRALPQASSFGTSFLRNLFSALFSPPPPPHPIPTAEATTELAVLLSHELAHLILSHHLETLSSSNVVIPGVSSMLADVARTLLFPFTMFFGPFVNDAVARIGKVGSGDLARLGEYCNSMKQEIEADVVSVRLLAHAGYDPQAAISFWQSRAETPQTAECSPTKAEREMKGDDGIHQYGKIAMLMTGSAHPQNQVRVGKLKEEFERWNIERRKKRKVREDGVTQS
ncbi:hypothetical protein GLOTRDRAFT_139510 [Gloeophyllum trabeum ATCC 11539]|uniref:Peptidase M48 domain-containing protein n=1 Tax=Gloeophyllum trabeum (strain ATCC 11539 / FP-39264 / Madison 617) TaxID=670483 RepID=S7Q260_GLOTA|nr:uncharacterized protein GLOTRDRAFT_139510 [Gloeophyllum trabeum ATCC 11539]EPQ54111.1 hypothetical protein GLOTRDRAFT_139510 [Gloeophyllum trabeum ATCC 11539]